MKHLCDTCKVNLAVWYYMPYSRDPRDTFFCEDCVPSRGCSCNIDHNTGKQYLDDIGRELPCCEYDYSETGYDP